MRIITNKSATIYGGIESGVDAFSAHLKRCGNHTLAVVSIHPTESFTIRKGHLSEHRIRLPAKFPGNNVYHSIRSLKGLKKRLGPLVKQMEDVIRKERIGAALVNGTYYASWCLLQAAVNARIPIIINYAGILTIETKGFPLRMRKLFRSLESEFHDSRFHYIFPSELAKKTVERIFPGIKTFSIIPNGVRDIFLGPNCTSTERGAIAFIGRSTGVKNFKFIVRFMDHLRKGAKGTKTYLVSDMRSSSRLARSLRRAGATLLRPMRPKALGKFYDRMSVIICPSHFETYGNVAIEAIARGTPALINPMMGVKETFERLGLNEMIVDFADTKKVAEIARDLSFKGMKGGVREKVAEHYNWDVIAERYVDACKQLMHCAKEQMPAMNRIASPNTPVLEAASQ